MLGSGGYYCVILHRQVQEGLLKEVAFYERSNHAKMKNKGNSTSKGPEAGA